MAEHLSLEEFFTKLSELFDSRKVANHGSVFLTQKRLSYSNDTAAVVRDSLADLQPSAPLPILMRATNGKSKDHRKNKIKLSTVVEPASLEVFYARYAEVCRSGMQGLKKRDRSGRKKGKAKKKKGGVEADKKI